MSESLGVIDGGGGYGSGTGNGRGPVEGRARHRGPRRGREFSRSHVEVFSEVGRRPVDVELLKVWLRLEDWRLTLERVWRTEVRIWK